MNPILYVTISFGFSSESQVWEMDMKQTPQSPESHSCSLLILNRDQGQAYMQSCGGTMHLW